MHLKEFMEFYVNLLGNVLLNAFGRNVKCHFEPPHENMWYILLQKKIICIKAYIKIVYRSVKVNIKVKYKGHRQI